MYEFLHIECLAEFESVELCAVLHHNTDMSVKQMFARVLQQQQQQQQLTQEIESFSNESLAGLPHIVCFDFDPNMACSSQSTPTMPCYEFHATDHSPQSVLKLLLHRIGLDVSALTKATPHSLMQEWFRLRSGPVRWRLPFDRLVVAAEGHSAAAEHNLKFALLRHYYHCERVAGCKFLSSDAKRFSGGLNFAVKGVHANVAEFDFEQLYPSIMLRWRIGCDSHVASRGELRECADVVRWVARITKSGEMVKVPFLREISAINEPAVELLQSLVSLRRECELPQLKRAFKQIANRVFGTLAYGCPALPTFSLFAAQDVAGIGREVLRATKQLLAGRFLVCYGDTDSLMVSDVTEPLQLLAQLNNSRLLRENRLALRLEEHVPRKVVVSCKRYVNVDATGTQVTKSLCTNRAAATEFERLCESLFVELVCKLHEQQVCEKTLLVNFAKCLANVLQLAPTLKLVAYTPDTCNVGAYLQLTAHERQVFAFLVSKSTTTLAAAKTGVVEWWHHNPRRPKLYLTRSEAAHVTLSEACLSQNLAPWPLVEPQLKRAIVPLLRNVVCASFGDGETMRKLVRIAKPLLKGAWFSASVRLGRSALPLTDLESRLRWS
jgi:hypothetical protein